MKALRLRVPVSARFQNHRCGEDERGGDQRDDGFRRIAEPRAQHAPVHQPLKPAARRPTAASPSDPEARAPGAVQRFAWRWRRDRVVEREIPGDAHDAGTRTMCRTVSCSARAMRGPARAISAGRRSRPARCRRRPARNRNVPANRDRGSPRDGRSSTAQHASSHSSMTNWLSEARASTTTSEHDRRRQATVASRPAPRRPARRPACRRAIRRRAGKPQQRDVEDLTSAANTASTRKSTSNHLVIGQQQQAAQRLGMIERATLHQQFVDGEPPRARRDIPMRSR